MSAHDPQSFEMSAFNFFRELQPDTNDSHLALFLEHFEKELAEMQAYMDAHGCSEREAFEAVFCEQATPEPCNGIPLPELPTIEELKAQQPPEFLKADGWFDVDVSGDYLDFEEPYESPKYTLSYNGIAFAPLGGIHALTGQSGHGKTMLFTQYMTAILSGQYGGLCYELSDIIPQPSVLYIDTEMEKCNTIGVKNRVCELVGWNPQERRDNFTILMLRETTTAQERWQKVLRSIYEKRPTVVFIDGLLDVVNDFNSNEECQRLIYKCMQVASHYGISVWCLVHQNPNTTKLVGHLGSMLERKVTDVFTSKKDTDERTGEVTFTVCQTKARGRDVPKWKFRVQPVGSYGRPEQIDESKDFDDIDEIQQWLRDGQNLIEWPATVSDIKRIFKECGGVGSSDRQQRDVEAAKNRRFIIEQPKEEWEAKQKHPKYNLNL